MKEPETLTSDIINKYLQQHNKNERYQNEENALIDLFEKFSENKNLLNIIPKVVIVNALYSTSIFDLYGMAEHIKKQNIDSDLEKGLPVVIEKVRKANLGGKERDCYSFATKYCNRHNKASYPIWDKYVNEMLWAYRKKDGFYEFKKEDLKKYETFKLICEEFRKHYNLEKFSFEEIDKFLWTYGKKLFPPKPKKQKKHS
jgi:hypothetical protein